VEEKGAAYATYRVIGELYESLPTHKDLYITMLPCPSFLYRMIDVMHHTVHPCSAKTSRVWISLCEAVHVGSIWEGFMACCM
jgi:hypothetical protein